MRFNCVLVCLNQFGFFLTSVGRVPFRSSSKFALVIHQGFLCSILCITTIFHFNRTIRYKFQFSWISSLRRWDANTRIFNFIVLFSTGMISNKQMVVVSLGMAQSGLLLLSDQTVCTIGRWAPSGFWCSILHHIWGCLSWGKRKRSEKGRN